MVFFFAQRSSAPEVWAIALVLVDVGLTAFVVLSAQRTSSVDEDVFGAEVG